VDEVLDRVRATGLLADGRPVVVLLSGGRDSVCLLDCAVALGAPVSALHVNYGLRPDADEDEEHCRELCLRLGVELAIERASKPEGAGNTQAWARDRRIGVAARLALARRGVVATGHTATDQAETVLYRLAASPGRRALLGMSARDGLLVRPLLGLTRAQTAAHNVARGLPWREDPTNATDQYARGRVRHELVPALERISPAAVQTINRTAELLRDEAEVLDVVVDTALAGQDRIAIDHLALLPRAVARLVVRRLAEDVAGGLCGRAATRLDDILGLRSGALDLGDGVRAVVEDGILRMVPTPPLRAHA
jgi:tRNA(Ile)-lysidine synthase